MEMAKIEEKYTHKNGSSAAVYTQNTSEYYSTNLEAEQEYIESYSIEVKVAFVTLACISLWSSLTAVILMHRSKKVPYATKFLSTGLLVFDVLFIVNSTIRKFITDHTVSLNLQATVALSLQLANLTVGLMSVERFLLIVKPFWYINTVTGKLVQKTVLLIWLCDISSSMFVRYGVCYLRFRTNLVFTKAGICNKIMSIFYGIILVIVLATSSTCYVKIFSCIRSKARPGQILSVAATARKIQSYRSTSLVFLYLIVIIASSAAYGVIIMFIQMQLLQNTSLRLAMDAVSTINCILDPFLYVLWFKECRLQLLTFVAVFLKRYRPRAEQMKIEVYNIVTKEVTNHSVTGTTIREF